MDILHFERLAVSARHSNLSAYTSYNSLKIRRREQNLKKEFFFNCIHFAFCTSPSWTVWPLKMGLTGSPETSVLNQLTPRNNSEDGRSQFYHGGSLRSRKSLWFFRSLSRSCCVSSHNSRIKRDQATFVTLLNEMAYSVLSVKRFNTNSYSRVVALCVICYTCLGLRVFSRPFWIMFW